jgi:hypothetical protein
MVIYNPTPKEYERMRIKELEWRARWFERLKIAGRRALVAGGLALVLCQLAKWQLWAWSL